MSRDDPGESARREATGTVPVSGGTRAGYAVRRLLQAVPVLLAIVVLNFLLLHLAPGDAASNLQKRVPLGRYGTIDEVCEAVTFLVSPAGAYVTGATLLIDGGTSLLGAGPFLDMMGG